MYHQIKKSLSSKSLNIGNNTNYRFTMDFNCGKGAIENIFSLIKQYGVPNTFIEIGIFEGSTLFTVNDQCAPINNKFKIYAIDPHVGSNDMTEDFNEVHNNFLYNLDVCKFKNVEYVQKYSKDGLLDLINKNVKAQLIYIDGDHKAGEVLTDLVLSWQLLDIGGVILCDDTTTWKFKDKNGTCSAQMSPRLAVESFIQCNWHKLNILNLPDGSQTAFMKVAE